MTRHMMRAVAIDRFGGPETLTTRSLPVPELGPGDVLVRVEWAGIGEWDPFEREGGFAELLGQPPRFPYVLGSEGAGTIEAVGEEARRFRAGDRVYAVGFLNPKGGFYAEYAALDARFVSAIPGGLRMEQAAVLGGVGITALRGVEDVLRLDARESVMIVGASGGVGHIALQLAKRTGARVLAVASGRDGVALVEGLGADAAVDGRREDVVAAARAFAPQGLDAALLLAGGDVVEKGMGAVRDGGRAAFPNGVEPPPGARPGVTLVAYDGEPESEIISRLNALIEAEPLEVHVSRSFPLDQAAQAHLAVGQHHLGKLALQVR